MGRERLIQNECESHMIFCFQCIFYAWNMFEKIQIPVQTSLGASPGFGTQPRYEALGELRVETSKTVINIGLVKLGLGTDSKLAVGSQIADKKNSSKNNDCFFVIFWDDAWLRVI